ncbi:hypothetical protein ACH5RR_029984 [Cinchona calisaya]|uniref:Uncharacterized protein n=1 Tax=Cinchona calisaya TaxID=153742 RepID=A0ABD2YTE6_9GENT
MVRESIKKAAAKSVCKASSNRGAVMKIHSRKKMRSASKDKEHEILVKRFLLSIFHCINALSRSFAQPHSLVQAIEDVIFLVKVVIFVDVV